MPEQSVALNPSESKVVSFKVTPTVAKTYQVSVDGLTGSFKAVAPPLVYICPYCKNNFIGLDEVITHQETCPTRLAIIESGYDAPIMYPCPYCSWAGYYEWDYWRHLWYHRPEIPKPEKYACPYCQSIFGTASELMAHIRSAHDLPAPTPTPEEAAFHLWDLSASAVVGQVSTVNLRIINYGGDTGSYSITATIDGQTSRATGKLTPAEQESAQFKFTPTRAGTHTITANGFTGSFEVQLPPGTITMSVSCPESAPGGSTVQAVVTYTVTPYVEWAKLTVIAYAGTQEFSLSTVTGTHTVPVSIWQPSDGYLYQRVTFIIDYGVYYAWSAFAGPVEVYIYLA